MIKILFIMLFIIPLCFFNCYWLFIFIFFIISFFFIINLSLNYRFSCISYGWGVDLLSYILILLRFWICSLIIIAREGIYKLKFYYKLFIFIILILIISLYLTLSSLNLFIFYLFFEIRLIPTLILIIGWGYQPERISAGVYLLFYTMLASLPMIIILFYLYKINYRLEFYLLKYCENSFFSYIIINMVFFVKIPIFITHLWLPKAHVEAPISGSMILAGVILKLGGYGLLRLIKLFSVIGVKLNFYLILLRLVGGVIVSLNCLRQSDMKSLIAYSSVAHIGLVVSGILTINRWGFWGSLLLILAHGLCSSGLFCLANISYERTSRRRIYLNKGLINLFPNLSLWWFVFCVCNIAAPPSLNLMGEIFLLRRLVFYRKILFIVLSILRFFRAVYSLYLYSFSQHGLNYSGIYSSFSINCREYLLLLLHLVPLNILFLKSDLVSIWVYLNSLFKILICGIKDIL